MRQASHWPGFYQVDYTGQYVPKVFLSLLPQHRDCKLVVANLVGFVFSSYSHSGNETQVLVLTSQMLFQINHHPAFSLVSWIGQLGMCLFCSPLPHIRNSYDPEKLPAFPKAHQKNKIRPEPRSPSLISVLYFSLTISPGRDVLWGNWVDEKEAWSLHSSRLSRNSHYDQSELGDPVVIPSFKLCRRNFLLIYPTNKGLLTLVPFYFT